MSQAGILSLAGSGGNIPTSIVTNAGTAVPAGNILNILGGNNITTTGAGNTVIVNVSGTTNNAMLIGNATGSISSVGPATNGQILIGVTGGAPVLSTLTAGANITITNQAGGIVISAVGGGGGGGLNQLSGNSGVAVQAGGNVNVITANSTVKFIGAGSTLTQDFGLTRLVLGTSLPALTTGDGLVGIGYQVFKNLTGGTSNVAIGDSACLSCTNESNNTAVGDGAMRLSVGAQFSTAIGGQTLVNAKTEATAVGYAALNALTTGDNNSAFGVECLEFCTIGVQNCGFGKDSLNQCINGSENVAFGFRSLVNGTATYANSAFGWNTLTNISTGQHNCAFGHAAGFIISSGGGNVGMGTSAVGAVTTGENNTALGFGALANGNVTHCIALGSLSGTNYNAGTETSNIVINHAGVAGENNVTRIGTQGNGQGQQNTCYIAGITGVAVANRNFVTINTTTGQLGSQNANLLWADASGIFTAVSNNGYFLSDASTPTLPAAPIEGDTISFILDVGALVTITASGAQKIRKGANLSIAGGTCASSTQGDAITLVYRSIGTTWIANSFIGTWNIT